VKISTPLLLGTLALFAVALALALPPIPQPASYHEFADSRTWLGIPNFWNLASNLPFFVVGLVGLLGFKRDFPSGMSQGLAPIYFVFYAAIALTALGSTYYHAGPENAALTWDRLPMAIAFMAFFSAVIGHAFGTRAARISLLPLLALGVFSVGYWHYTETAGRGDLRLYVVVQYLPMLLLPFILVIYRDRFPGRAYLWGALGVYALSKLFEGMDKAVFEATGWISGHSIKHLVAAWGAWLVYLGLRQSISNRQATARDEPALTVFRKYGH